MLSESQRQESLQLDQLPKAGRLKWKWIVCVIAVVLGFAAIHGRRAAASFDRYQWEDTEFIAHNQMAIASLADCFTVHPLWFDVYRPLTTNLYYYLGRLWFRNDIRVHHAINIAIYLINALLLFWICQALLPGWWALLPPVLWVTRIAHVEIIANSCEFQGLLAAFFALLSLGLFIKARRDERPWPMVVSVVAFSLALLSKETAIVLTGIVIAFGLLYDRPREWRHYLGHVSVSALWVVLYFAVYKRLTAGDPSGLAFGWSVGDMTTYLAAYFLLFSDLLIYPLKDVVMDAHVAALAAHWSIRIAIVNLCAAAGLYAIFRPRLRGQNQTWERPFAFGMLFFVCAAAPHLILKGRLFMRYSYLMHAGLAIAVTALLWQSVEFVRKRVRRTETQVAHD